MKGRWIFYAAAALLGSMFDFTKPFIVIAAFLAMAVFLRFNKRFSNRQIYFIFFTFAIFLVRGELADRENKTRLTGTERIFHIHFSGNIKTDGDLLTAEGIETVHNEKLIVRYKMKSEQEKRFLSETMKTGVFCKLIGELEKPASATNENAFNYKEYLTRNKIFWVLKIDSLHFSSCSPQKKTFLSFFQKARADGIIYIQNHFPKESAPLVQALLFGYRDSLDQDIMKSYQKLGIVHLLAISGLHVGMIAGIIYYLGIRAGLTKEKMILFLLLFLPCYALVTGASPSVIRAVFMMVLFLGLKKWCQALTLSAIDIISIVFMVYIFVSPLVIYDVGFQLSFCVSFSLILSAPIILKRSPHPISALFITSFICQLAAFPIMFYYFYEVSVISILANVIFVPLFTLLVLPGAFLLFFLHLLFGENIAFLLNAMNQIVIIMDKFSWHLSLFPFSTLTLGRPPKVIILMYLIILPLFFWVWEKLAKVKEFLQALSLPIVVLLIHSFVNTLSPFGEITFIDVGQGDSIFIKMPYGKGNYLIDTGGTLKFSTEKWRKRQKQYDVGKDVVVPFLKSKGITVIDKLILTHGDMDHIGGTIEVMKNVTVKEIILPKSGELAAFEKEILRTAEKRGIAFRFTAAGDYWKSGSNVIFHVLSPPQDISMERNDGSIVLFAQIGGLSWLFTGDLEEGGEEKLINHYNQLKIDVLKVGHHGSKTSTSQPFLDQLNPKIAIISAGKKNRYGHPNREILDKLAKKNIKVFRTDQQGAITYIFNGNSGTFSVQFP